MIQFDSLSSNSYCIPYPQLSVREQSILKLFVSDEQKYEGNIAHHEHLHDMQLYVRGILNF